MKWRNKLTKAELKHLREEAFDHGTLITLAGLESMFEKQAKMRKADSDFTWEPCWTCRGIAKKLGFTV